jgi:putative ABC transport system substrate-binding protein
MSDVRRRDFITLLGGAVAAWPLAAHAQQPAMPVIGFLRSTTEAGSAQLVAALRQGLKEAGFVEGQDVAIDFRWGDDQPDRLPGLAADLVRRQVAVIIGNVLATQAAMTATTAIPIVFLSGGDPVRRGLVGSLNRPGGNVTGVVFTSVDLTAKRLGLLHELVPKSAIIAALVQPGAPWAEFQVKEAEEAGRSIGRQVLIVKAADERDFAAAFGTIVQAGGGGLLSSPHAARDRRATQFRRGRRPDELRSQPDRCLSPCRPLRRPDSQRSEARRPAGRAGDQDRSRHQPRNCEGARRRNPRQVTSRRLQPI